MRWLKHLSCAHRDEKITALISECGLEGYGFFWVLCEVIAESMDKSDKCDLTHPLPQWSHLLYSHHHRVSKYLGKLQVIGLCEVSEVAGSIRVAIPNLLKYRDEYASRVGTKSGQNRESVPSKIENQKQNTEVEDNPQTPAATAAERKPPKPAKEPTAADLLIAEIAPQIHQRHPTARRCSLAVVVSRLTSIARALPAVDRLNELAEINRRHQGWCESHDWTKEGNHYAKGLEPWLSPTKGLWRNEPPSQSLIPFEPRAPVTTFAERNEEIRNRKFLERMSEELRHG